MQGVLLAAEWAPLLSAEITLIHAMEPITYPDFYAHYTLRENHLNQLGERCHQALAEIGVEHLQAVTHDTAVIYAQAADGISEYASSHDFDLVVLATRGLSGITHALFGSVAERVTQISKVPVLTVRGPAETPSKPAKKEKRYTTFPRRSGADREDPATFSVERSPNRTVLRLHGRESLAGTDLRLISRLWDFFEDETGDPKPILVVLAPPDLLGPANLERLLGGPNANESLTVSEIRARIIREENVIQRFIKGVRRLDSFVIGVVGGDVALPLAAPLLACDYRIVSPDTIFVNTTQTLPRAPLGCLPWLLSNLLGGAKATQLLLDVPRLSAEDALALGLVNHVTAPDRLEEEAFEVADRLGSLPRATLMGLKRSMTASSDDFTSYLNQELALTEQLASPRWAEHLVGTGRSVAFIGRAHPQRVAEFVAAVAPTRSASTPSRRCRRGPARLEHGIARHPPGRRRLGAAAGADDLVGLDLSDGLGDPAAHRRRQDLHGLDDAVGIDDEPTAQLDPLLLVVDAVGPADVAGLVGEHVERDPAVDHLDELVVVPHLVDEVAVDADREDLATEILELLILVGDRRHFGRSNKGEVTGIETEEEPLAEVVGELDVGEAAFVVRRCVEIGGFLSDTCCHGLLLVV